LRSNGATLRDVFHALVKQILGFPGSAEQRLAIKRGELDGDCGSYSSIPLEWIKGNQAHSFVRFTKDRPPEVPEGATYIGDFATTDAQRQLLKVLIGGDELGRPFVMSKDVPPRRPALPPKALAEMEKAAASGKAADRPEAAKIVEEQLAAPADRKLRRGPVDRGLGKGQAGAADFHSRVTGQGIMSEKTSCPTTTAQT
jgi:hypothetical protein